VVREAQRRAIHLGHVAVVPTVDLPLSDGIHISPDGNLTLGSRKARAALACAYERQPANWQAPDVTGAMLTPERTAIELAFTHVANRLMFLGPGEGDFVVEDADGVVPILAATCKARDRVRLELGRLPRGEVYVHGAFGANPPANLRDAEENTPMLGFYGLPVRP